MKTVGEALVRALQDRGVDIVFGIPGVHTIELYRGLAVSGIRHVTPRHEQGAGFMADGYARVSGKPGVAFVITGPGLTNTITPMAQARADSVPMLVVSSVNPSATLGKGLGHLHELPDQHALAASVATRSDHLSEPDMLFGSLDGLFEAATGARPSPVHLEIPMDVLGREVPGAAPAPAVRSGPAEPDAAMLRTAAEHLSGARAPVILAGGGARRAGPELCRLAELLDAPVIQTTNARGLMHAHPLTVPASPSLEATRRLIEEADAVLAVGTELGPTDYDMNATGRIARTNGLVRIDTCAAQLARHPADFPLQGDAAKTMRALSGHIGDVRGRDGAARAAEARQAAWAELDADMQTISRLLTVIRQAVPGAIIVGDSTQPVYAGNLYHDHDRPGGWFNAATGYGALGYGIPAAIGAALADPEAPVICITGDGGAQFSMAELMTARDENLPVTFVVWNSGGYLEIEKAMQASGVSVVGCDPSPPDFADLARACGMPHRVCAPTEAALADALWGRLGETGPAIVEVDAR